LAELVAKARKDVSPVDRVSRDNVTFSQILSDKETRTTAIVAVKDTSGQLAPPAEPALLPPPPAADKLPIVPLPAGNLLEGARLRAEPPDELTELAADRAQLPSDGERAQPGTEGQYQIQIASFRSGDEAAQYVTELRLRGHRAYSQPASVPNRGVWHRVRVGPFKTKADALRYKAEFERKEAMATFLVDPEKLQRRESQQSVRLTVRDD
jgi:cell division septation protein DedD